DSKKPVYFIDTPPPFPTGEFHMGGVLNWSYIDFSARFHRMRGYNVLFPQGWDCHGFPTEVKVEKKHGRNLSRAEFREKCLEWTHDVVSTMKTQMRQMAFSIDWNYEYYTINPEYYKVVQYSLLKMFEQKLVYHAQHPVLWCPTCASAITKAETEETQRETVFNYLKFECASAVDGVLLIATTRPELLHACVAVFVHPSDARYSALVGKTAVTPLYNKEVPIVADVDVDKEFGTGVVMVCTFGDKSDVVWTYRHKLSVIEAMDGRGRLKNSGLYDGIAGHSAKLKIIEDLQQKGFVEKQEKLVQTVKLHDRCKKPIELLNSLQWFIKLKGVEDKVKQAASSMEWYPEHAYQLLADWADGLEWDWCISRQRVFGIPLPFWYCDCCGEVLLPSVESLPVDPAKDKPPVEKCSCGGAFVGEKSICDGWVDSSITPLFVAGWPFDQKKFEHLYPAAVRPQGTDIIRTWAFYTILRCIVLVGAPPFKQVLVNGMVCGEKDGKKMSKSLGNYVEAKDVVARSSVDALRQWAALSGSTGKDNIFYWKDVLFAQGFLNKLWNASKFVEKATVGAADCRPDKLRLSDEWILSKYERLVKKTTDSLRAYDFYSALTSIHSFTWHDLCDNYLEDVKYRVYGDDVDSKQAAQWTLRRVLEGVLRLLAPFAPYSTEEIYSQLYSKGESIHSCKWPDAEEEYLNDGVEKIVGALHEVLSAVRKYKATNALALSEELSSATVIAPETTLKELADVEEEMRNVGRIKTVLFKAKEEGELEVQLSV
ncbi:TPA: valine--tRNA ligase, partial [Candidatus Micrarchaeota archaeon]|nr:valine--tRNA ligase [Candidatus Micrarchaeota archaeon]